MKVDLAYGKTSLSVSLPDQNRVTVLTHAEPRALDTPELAVLDALERPIGSKSLREMAKGMRNACIAICDITRPVPNKILLPPLLTILESSGVARENITILIATGLHRPSTQDELLELLGHAILDNYRVYDHNARSKEEHRYLGRSSRDIPIEIDRRYCDADFKITVGFIEPHLMAGFSGGRKLIAPGCASIDTIKGLHSPMFIEDAHVCEGSIEDNPLHHHLLEIADIAGHDFTLNVALNPARKITGVFAGDPRQAYKTGIDFVRHSVTSKISNPAHIVVTTAGGYPLDQTYYQAIKGLTAALPVVAEGGMIILAAKCSEGLGSQEFSSLATRFGSVGEFMEWIQSHPVTIDQWQLEECAKVMRKAEVVLVSEGIPKKEKEKLFVKSAESVEDALAYGIERLGASTSIAVVPNGPYTLVDVLEKQ